MKRIPYERLRNIIINSDNKLYFEFTNLLSARSSEEEMFSYLLGSDDVASIDYISVSCSKLDTSCISIDLFCSSYSSCNEATVIIKDLISETPRKLLITIYDYNGHFVSFCQENGCIRFENVVKTKSFVYSDNIEYDRLDSRYQSFSIHNVYNNQVADGEIARLIKAIPDWERHIRMSYNSLDQCSDAFYIIYNGDQPIGYLSNMICTVEEYRDVALILIARDYRGKGLATLLAKHYIDDTLKKNKIPLYTNAGGIESEKVAQKAGLRYQYLRVSADIIT